MSALLLQKISVIALLSESMFLPFFIHYFGSMLIKILLLPCKYDLFRVLLDTTSIHLVMQ